MQAIKERLHEKLARLYGPEHAPQVLARILEIAAPAAPDLLPRTELPLSEKDVLLITYGDMVRREGEPPLQTLHGFLKARAADVINSVHILPFYPYSSDDGFSVIDYFAVDPALGTWDDIARLRSDFRLMFDAVFNHISARSTWFRAFLRCEAPYDQYFHVVDPTLDLSAVRRPRTHPLLTRFETACGEKYVWTTFSEDQIDLNAANPDVLIELIRALVFYVQQGADLIRLDAIAYLWKTIGTSCIHLPETHLVVQLMRDVLDMIAPHVVIITETNVPHDENISYFGDGQNEAQMVYQFSLPPLLLHTFRTGDVTALARWARTIAPIGKGASWFNFTASHDGIGVTPLRGLVSDADVDALVQLAGDHGGFVNYKNNSDGTRSPYELNITYFDAITHPEITAREPETAVRRFLLSQAIMLAFVGVPGVYFHSLFGSRNWRQGVQITGHNRTINRQKFEVDALSAELDSEGTIRARVFTAYRNLLRARIAEPAFHPLGAQRVLDAGDGVFALDRTSPDGASRVVALFNVRGENADVHLPVQAGGWIDLLRGTTHEGGSSLKVTLGAYQVVWLKAAP